MKERIVDILARKGVAIGRSSGVEEVMREVDRAKLPEHEHVMVLVLPGWWDAFDDGTRYRKLFMRLCQDSLVGVVELLNSGKVSDRDPWVDASLIWHESLETCFVGLLRAGQGGFIGIAALTAKGKALLPDSNACLWAKRQRWVVVDSWRYTRGPANWLRVVLELPETVTTTNDAPNFDGPRVHGWV